MKNSITFIGLLMLSTVAFAGGSIFGGHKTRTSNPNGVSSIGIHICGSLNCPDVILKNGDCGTVEHATTKYGVCVCDDGYRVNGTECVKAGCSDSEKVEKTVYYGACCNVEAKDTFCPDEEPPACVKMDEAACAADTEEACHLTTGTWECGDDASSDCICSPEGAKVKRSWGNVIACRIDEWAKCSQWESCICGPNDKVLACAKSGGDCTVCHSDQVAKCSTYGGCACGPNEKAVACNEFGTDCTVCHSDQVAKCSQAGDCACGPNDNAVKCNEFNCATCEVDQTAVCDGGYGSCTCV